MRVGVVATSAKEHEHRLPIHPLQLDRLPAELRGQVLLEEGYGARWHIPDVELAPLVGGLRPRHELLSGCDVVLLPKPQHEDVAAMHAGQVLWGWPHCVQDPALTQLAIDRRLTLVAWEAMNHWSEDGVRGLHVFHVNNEIAGFAAVLHATTLTGFTGVYGPRRRAIVINFGATARGAVKALQGIGIFDVSVVTHRQAPAVAAPMSSVLLGHYGPTDEDPTRTVANTPHGVVPLAELLVGFDVVVNCVLQDTDAPLMFLTWDEVALMRRGSLIVDVSCDTGMGFEFARPTSFDRPTFLVGDGVTYYAVDHTPSYLWDSTTWEISEALLPFLPTVLAGPSAWDADPVIKNAIEIRDGVIQNPKILSFQRRAAEYPHAPLV